MTTPRRIDGVDLSHHNALVDFKVLVASGVKWAYHKATEGVGFKDPVYAARKTKAKNAGMPFGAYHFALPDSKADARDEARHFKATAHLEETDLLPMLDLERVGPWSDHPMDHLTTWVGDFIDEVGQPCIVYTPYPIKDFFGSPRWRPRYNDQNTPPVLGWEVWQFSNGDVGVPDHVPGAGHCDLNTHASGFTLEDLLREDDVALSDADIKKIADAVWDRHAKNYITPPSSQAETLFSRIHQRTFNTLALVEAIAAQQMTEAEITEVINAAIAAGIDIEVTVTPGD